MNIKEVLFKLSSLDSVGAVHDAADYAAEELKKYAEVERRGAAVIGKIKGSADYTVLLDAHIDQVAFTVTDIDGEGFITAACCGGIDLRALPARAVTVHGKKNIPAVFCSTPPHLASGEVEYSDIASIKLDTMLGAKAKDLVSLGDYITFSAEPAELSGRLITGRSFDDRAGVACLLKTSELLADKPLPCNVVLLFSDAEELGMRGAAAASFGIHPDEVIAVDVTFGDGIGISAEECGKLGGGPMIGFSPVLDSGVSKKLCNVAAENGINYAPEVMGGRTGTNADVLSVAESGAKTCTVSIPLRNMHTEVETISLADIESSAELLAKYILSGGLLNA